MNKKTERHRKQKNFEKGKGKGYTKKLMLERHFILK